MVRGKYGDLPARDLHLLVVLVRCTQSVERRLFAHIRQADLTPPQFDVLEALYHRGPMTVNTIIEKTLSSSGNTGVVVDNLIKRGLVEKSVDETDRRVRRVALTDQGFQRMEEYFPRHLAEVQRAFGALEPEEKATLTLLLRKLGKSV